MSLTNGRENLNENTNSTFTNNTSDEGDEMNNDKPCPHGFKKEQCNKCAQEKLKTKSLFDRVYDPEKETWEQYMNRFKEKK